MRRIFLAVLLGVLVMLLTLAWRPNGLGASADQTHSDMLIGNSDPPDLLYQRIDRIDLDDVPIERAIGQIAGSFKVNHVIVWPDAYKALALPLNGMITLHLRNVTVGQALQAVLDAATGGAIKIGITDGIITIAGEGYFYENDIEVYDIRDLLEDHVRYGRRKGLKVPASQPADPYRRALLAYLDLIKKETGFAVQETQDANNSRPFYFSTAYPDYREVPSSVWYDELAGRLIITAPRPMQNRIRQLLDQFRRQPLREDAGDHARP